VGAVFKTKLKRKFNLLISQFQLLNTTLYFDFCRLLLVLAASLVCLGMGELKKFIDCLTLLAGLKGSFCC
jgi:hypothetical protein